MWATCPTVLDEPVTLYGIEFDDLCVLLVAGFVLSLVIDILLALGVMLGSGIAIRFLKRGRPPGALLHALHDLALIALPGVLSPRGQTYSPWGDAA